MLASFEVERGEYVRDGQELGRILAAEQHILPLLHLFLEVRKQLQGGPFSDDIRL